MEKNNNRNNLLKLLSDAGIRPSVQRLAVLEYVSSCRNHPTADEIYTALVKENPTLSRTTVFSSVKLLAEKGLINNINIAADSTRYDTTSLPPHAHFLCRKCNKIFDMPLDISTLRVPGEFICDSVNVFFEGTCPECKAKNKQ